MTLLPILSSYWEWALRSECSQLGVTTRWRRSLTRWIRESNQLFAPTVFKVRALIHFLLLSDPSLITDQCLPLSQNIQNTAPNMQNIQNIQTMVDTNVVNMVILVNVQNVQNVQHMVNMQNISFSVFLLQIFSSFSFSKYIPRLSSFISLIKISLSPKTNIPVQYHGPVEPNNLA